MIVCSFLRSINKAPNGLIVALLLSLFALPLRAAGPQEAEITFIHKERSLQPGEAVLFEARSSHPLKQLQVEAFGGVFPAFSEDGGLRWVGLAGIDLNTGPGNYKVTLRGTGKSGEKVNAGELLVVKSKKFPTRELAVEPKYVTPPADVLARIQRERARVDGIFNSATASKLWNGSFLLPITGKVISAFGKRSVYNGKPGSPHRGADFRGATGTPIRAPNAGKVVLVSDLYYTGKTVILDHGLGLYSYFGHMSSISVEEGTLVQSGDIVGEVGATGMVTGPHLHWTVCLGGIRVDPISLIDILAKP